MRTQTGNIVDTNWYRLLIAWLTGSDVISAKNQTVLGQTIH